MAKTLKEHNFFGFDATVVADSKNVFGDRLTTMVVTLPRIVLAEFNTHRLFSRNSASSRAIPFNKMVERVRTNPFIPVAWQKEHTGMQGTDYIEDSFSIELLRDEWITAASHAVAHAKRFASGIVGQENSGITKQICNRLLEPFLWHTIIVSSTEWENFFSLRCPQYNLTATNHNTVFRSRKDYIIYNDKIAANEGGDNSFIQPQYEDILGWLQINKSQADIHIQFAAEVMWDAMNESTPKQLKESEWHIPFRDDINNCELGWYIGSLPIDHPLVQFTHKREDYDQIRLRIAIAQCARLSYGNIDPNMNYDADIKLYDRLLSSKHASPFEHVAQSMTFAEYNTFYKGQAHNGQMEVDRTILNIKEQDGFGWCNNFKGFIQERYKLNI